MRGRVRKVRLSSAQELAEGWEERRVDFGRVCVASRYSIISLLVALFEVVCCTYWSTSLPSGNSEGGRKLTQRESHTPSERSQQDLARNLPGAFSSARRTESNLNGYPKSEKDIRGSEGSINAVGLLQRLGLLDRDQRIEKPRHVLVANFLNNNTFPMYTRPPTKVDMAAPN